MASGVNQVILVGNLGRDPELRFTPNGQPVCSFSVATSDSWTDKNGQKQERTEWHRIVVWGKQGELCAQYLAKGRMVYVSGRIQSREWDDKEGQKRTTVEIIADRIQFLGGAGGASRANTPSGDTMPYAAPQTQTSNTMNYAGGTPITTQGTIPLTQNNPAYGGGYENNPSANSSAPLGDYKSSEYKAEDNFNFSKPPVDDVPF